MKSFGNGKMKDPAAAPSPERYNTTSIATMQIESGL
jgi:hypothetical protein